MPILQTQLALALTATPVGDTYTFSIFLDAYDPALPGFRYERASELVRGTVEQRREESVSISILTSCLPKFIPRGTVLQLITGAETLPTAVPLYLQRFEVFSVSSESTTETGVQIGEEPVDIGGEVVTIGGDVVATSPSDILMLKGEAFYRPLESLENEPSSVPGLLPLGIVEGFQGFGPSEASRYDGWVEAAVNNDIQNTSDFYSAFMPLWAGEEIGGGHIVFNWQFITPGTFAGLYLWASSQYGVFSVVESPPWPTRTFDYPGVRQGVECYIEQYRDGGPGSTGAPWVFFPRISSYTTGEGAVTPAFANILAIGLSILLMGSTSGVLAEEKLDGDESRRRKRSPGDKNPSGGGKEYV